MSSGGLAGLATQRLNEVLYCSRFFDLNDEVEQELVAEDDFLSINISASQQENYEEQRKQFKVTSAIEQTAKSSSHSSSLAPQSQSLEFAPQIQAHTPGKESLQALEPESFSNPYQFTGTTGVESICEQVSKDDGFCVNSCTQQHVTG
ncbi:unnamed protein product [Sphagnum jensenii]|uniref:Uncharacterized protein n=1 Tax=Sphagnum jensenii TaxID=128206 RepID=A0ABP1A1Z7_9BRYO